MEIVNKGMTIVMTACCILCSCSDEPLMSEEADLIAASPVSLQSRGLDAVSGQTAWRDIRGFDPSLPGQAVEVELPVSCGGAETSVTARLSIMPMHVYEENGPDRLGDYYVVEADFTAHNGPMWEKGMFMKSLDVKVTPTDKQGKPIPGITFHDNPTPATTVANQTFRASTTAGVRGGAAMGMALPHVEYVPQSPGLEVLRLEPYFHENTNGKLFIMEKNKYTEISCKDVYTVDYNGKKCFFFHKSNFNRLYDTSDGNICSYEEGEEIVFYYYCFKRDSNGYIKRDADGTPILKKYETLPEGNIGKAVVEDSRLIIEYEYRTPPGEDIPVLVPAKFYSALGIACGCSWSKEQSIRVEDVTTSLRTGVDASVEYLYTVENYRSGRGIPEAARSDFHGHATWVWRMPVHDSSLTAEQLVSSLYDMHIEVSPVYAAAGSPDRNLLPAAATVSHTESLEPPMRGKCTAVDFSNPSGAAVGHVRLLSVPYAEWEAAGRPDNDVIAEYDGTLGRGQSCTLTAPDMDCWVVCEEFDPLTLRYGRVRQSLPLHVRMDACNPRPLEVSTLDTSAVQ